MFGNFGGDFYAGFRDRGEALLGQRQKAVEAFNEFKRQNPTASYAEFQQYVDSITGGDNYLRGQLPAEQILRTLGAEGDRRKADEADQRAFERIKRTAERDALYEQIARGAWQNGMDPTAAAEEYAKANGIEDPAARLALTQQLNTVHGRKRQAWETEETNAYWDRVNQQIQSGMLTDESAIGADAPKYLATLPAFQQRSEAARSALQRQNLRYQQESFERAERMAESLAQNVEVLTADQAGAKVVAAMREQGYIREGDKAAENLIRSIAHRATARYQEARAARQAQENDGLQQYLLSPAVMQAVRVGGRPAFEEHVRGYEARMGRPKGYFQHVINSPEAFTSTVGLINVGGREALTGRMLQLSQNAASMAVAQQKRNKEIIDATLGRASERDAGASAIRGLAEQFSVNPDMLSAILPRIAKGEFGTDPGTIRNNLMRVEGFVQDPAAMAKAYESAAGNVQFETIGRYRQGISEDSLAQTSAANAKIEATLTLARNGKRDEALATLEALRAENEKMRSIIDADVRLRTVDLSWIEADGEPASPQAVIAAAEPARRMVEHIDRRIAMAMQALGPVAAGAVRTPGAPRSGTPSPQAIASSKLTDDQLGAAYGRALDANADVATLGSLKQALQARARNDLIVREHNRVNGARDSAAERRQRAQREAEVRQAELQFR